MSAATKKLGALPAGAAKPDEAYLAGLLHDLGLILIDQYVHAAFCRVIDALAEGSPICEVEGRILGFDHTQLGEFVARRGIGGAVVIWPNLTSGPYQLGEIHDRVSVLAETNGLHAWDLLGPLTQRGNDLRRYTLSPHDSHPNTLANQQVAEFLFAKIVRTPEFREWCEKRCGAGAAARRP